MPDQEEMDVRKRVILRVNADAATTFVHDVVKSTDRFLRDRPEFAACRVSNMTYFNRRCPRLASKLKADEKGACFYVEYRVTQR